MELFLAALEVEGAARDEVVAGIEPADVRERVQRLLEAHAALGDRDPFAIASSGTADPRVIGLRFDGLEIVGELGRGGMGVVYEAQQQTPSRRVALKTLAIGQSDDASQRRLEREAETLARLAHPGIAQVYGCGRAGALGGVPYLVMERVDGIHVDAFCRRHELGVSARLELLAAICDAVGHAHDQRVVHRDLKPQNVLVQRDGSPKVLDFGIARVTDANTAASLLTRTGQLLGTLAYMAPEQLHGPSSGATEPRVDVYALGVMGYELLAGRLPIEIPDLPLASAVRRLAELEPEPLSRAVPALRGDVDVVIGKAIDREPGRRYADANALAGDLRRIVENQPVSARAPSAAYQLTKFVRRHRGLCAAIVAIIAALTVGLAWALIERGQARHNEIQAERAAEREAARATAMARTVDLLHDLLATTTPEVHGGSEASLTEVVDDIAATVDNHYADQPFLLGNVHLLLVEPLYSRGESTRAAHHLARAQTELGRSELTGDRERILLALAESWVARAESRFDAAVAAGRDAWTRCAGEADPRLRRRVLLAVCSLMTRLRADLDWMVPSLESELAAIDDTAPAFASLQRGLALLLDAQERHEDALRAWDRCIEVGRRDHDAMSLATALQNKALLFLRLSRPTEAVPIAEEALAIYREMFSDRSHPKLGMAIDNLASALHDAGQLDRALALHEEAEALFRALYPGAHLDLAVCLTEQGRALASARQVDDARHKLEEAVAMFEELEAHPLPQHAAALEHLTGLDAFDRSDPVRIERARRAVEMRRAIHGDTHILVARALECLAQAQLVAGDIDGSEAAGRECLEIRLAEYGEADWRTWAVGLCVWLPLARRGEFEDAAALIERAIAAGRAAPTPWREWIDAWYAHLVEVRRLQGDDELREAAEAAWREVLGR